MYCETPATPDTHNHAQLNSSPGKGETNKAKGKSVSHSGPCGLNLTLSDYSCLLPLANQWPAACLHNTKVTAQLTWNLDGGATKKRTRYQVPGTFFADGNAKERRGELRWYCRWKRGKTILTNNCPSPGENSWLCSSFPLACFPKFQFSAAFSLPPAVRETKHHTINPIKLICPTLYNCVVDIILFEAFYLFLLFLVFCRFGIKVLLQSSPGGFQGLLPSHDQSWIFTWEKPCMVNSTS